LQPTRSMIKCTEVKQWWNRRPMTTGEFRTVLSVRMLGSLVVTLNGTVVDTESSRRTRQIAGLSPAASAHRRPAGRADGHILACGVTRGGAQQSARCTKRRSSGTASGISSQPAAASSGHLSVGRRSGLGRRRGIRAALRRGLACRSGGRHRRGYLPCGPP
jgi:hypothetical protein